MPSFPLIPKSQQKNLSEALHFAKMAELQEMCTLIYLPNAGTKSQLIERIMTFINTGIIQPPPRIPDVSRAKAHPAQSLQPKSLMLYGSYKNDAKTRAFFKQLVGSHFHFTAFGIDWLNNRWMTGNPPTYQEFADYWSTENDRRKKHPEDPKQEWRYIRFVQAMNVSHPGASKDTLMDAWKHAQAEQANYARRVIEGLRKLKSAN
jgi:hypothetical protein